ncbi:MAG: rRNA maturation RNase YbeY [Ruminococcaceae bacterium]|nr:rRNA maturation RNase YbeY [Oscillospiraceae bacterium]
MTELLIENNQEKAEITPELTDLLQKVCEAVLTEEECDFDAQISLTFVDNEQIRRINAEFREKDTPTDVLSFPMLEFDENGDIIDAEYDFDGETVILGDIIISTERALEQAEEFGHTFVREVAFLCVHSMLHLLGYDHVDDPEGEAIMREKQTRILNELGIRR